MKRFAAAKTRLREHLDVSARMLLAQRMFETVLSAAISCKHVAATYVLTNGEDVERIARAAGAQVLTDPGPVLPPAPLGELIDWGLRTLQERGATRVVVLMADLPQLRHDDVSELCQALARHALVATPDRRGRSTNALGVHLPFPAPTAFGHPDSYAQHLACARALAWPWCELRNTRLAHDVDLAEDLLDVPR
jgi:2-phospho-L-lactate guanylyltransferase